MKFLNLSILTCGVILTPLMMFLMLLFFPDPNTAKAYYLMNKCTSFDVSEKLALEDFAKGKRQIIIGGMPDGTDRKVILDSILRAEYQIEMIYAGCVGPTDEAWRYSETVINELAKIHGQDFYDRAQKKTAILRERLLTKLKPVPFERLPIPPAIKRLQTIPFK